MAHPESFKRYEDTSANIKQQLEDIKLLLKAHKVRAKASPENWGFNGDLLKVEADLGDIIEFLQSK